MAIRDEIIQALTEEIVGPSTNREYIDGETGQEILLTKIHGSPKSRYGAGMLYPQQTINLEMDDNASGAESLSDEDVDKRKPFDEEGRNGANTENGSDDEEPVGLANQYLPSAMGYTIRMSANQADDQMSIKVESAYYVKSSSQKTVKKISSEGRIEAVKTKDGELLSDYWIRKPILVSPIDISVNELIKSKAYNKVLKQDANGKEWLKLQIYNRTTDEDKKDGLVTFTYVLINCLKASTDEVAANHQILFQNKIILATKNPKLIAPYRERAVLTDTEEERELNLLYRKKRIFAIGHGCAVSWRLLTAENEQAVLSVETSVLPVFEMPQVAPTSHIELSMLHLSDLGDWNVATQSLSLLVNEYEKWINVIEKTIPTLPVHYRYAAQANISKCRTSLSRIKRGVDLLTREDASSTIVKSFRWMNRAMIWQQQRSKAKQRRWVKIKTDNAVDYDLELLPGRVEHFVSLKDFHDSSLHNGRWRPFQLAFILTNIESIMQPESDERKIVDLIWFPTGGGKTEAYLGQTALTIFFRRLKGRTKFNWGFYGGTAVVMRYTLRLLTTQQYERAASLICACDIIRKQNLTELGDEPISIGLWVGGTSTPNEHAKAKTQFNALQKYKHEQYNFIVLKCPCCAAQIGKLENVSKDDKVKVKGIRKHDGGDGKVMFQCENRSCEYYSVPLPLNVVDQYIYEKPPSLVIGTVDKFAMLPWKKEYDGDASKVDASCIFGFRQNQDGRWHRILPPELIIQDELHLISGPLGTMVGLYETMIQTLCNDYGKYTPPFLPEIDSRFDPPKIVASSATISRAYEQVRNLYGISDRSQLHIFPSQGLEFGNTWFSAEKSLNETDEKGRIIYPGRMYVGLLTSGYPSAQTSIVRSYAAVLQKIKELENRESIGYYWTLLGYFNSIRELGGASSLVFGDIRERLSQIQNRELLPFDQRRKLFDWKIQELTSRINSSEIPEVLKKLEEEFSLSNNKAIDICLATNMVATGVDISRLGLMFIHGQPKTTAEYIQASSRVGRKLPEGPGLVFTLFSPSKPRDKSQYEQFQSYHSRIYSNVEPTSVTPFSINSRERALHAIFIGLIRHFAGGSLRENARTDSPEFESLSSKVKDVILSRCRIVDPEEYNNTSALIDQIKKFWQTIGVQHYGDAGNYRILNTPGYYPLMYANSSEVREEIVIENRAFRTPTSMRGVDTESVVNVYSNTNE